MEYKKEYRTIEFRVVFSRQIELQKDVLSFAAQPYELLLESDLSEEHSQYLVYGKIEKADCLEVGFKGFTFEMSQDLHSRLGLLYERVKGEYRKTVLKKV